MFSNRGGIFSAPGTPAMVEVGQQDRVPQNVQRALVPAVYQQRVAMQGFGATMTHGPADPMRPLPVGSWRYVGASDSGIFQQNFSEPSGRRVGF